MSAVVIVWVVCLLAVVIHVSILVWDRIDDRIHPFSDKDSYAIPAIDNMSSEDAAHSAYAILQEFGIPRKGGLPNDVSLQLESGIKDVLNKYELLAFDSFTNYLDARSEELSARIRMHPTLGRVLRIGTWGSGENIYVAQSPKDANIYIEEGEEYFLVIAPTMYHFVIKAKQDSGSPDERIQK